MLKPGVHHQLRASQLLGRGAVCTLDCKYRIFVTCVCVVCLFVCLAASDGGTRASLGHQLLVSDKEKGVHLTLNVRA